jgi:hypothetical protein
MLWERRLGSQRRRNHGQQAHLFPSVHKVSSNLRIFYATNLTGGLAGLEKINIAVAIQKKFAAEEEASEKLCSEKEFDALCRRLEF